ncbi:MAG: DCC1-like thiol-disulfide oxidoreductase family protein [Candidatus Bipolaricaulota bacterium]|nr:DCC1-like thiol-disulfide oxidoreductase family protein [Candidatus Bipolaricaulota bacterium]
MAPKLLLIYDGTCAYCRGFARLVRALDWRKKFALLPYESERAQHLLRAQFGENVGFAMFLFDEESVSWGREAARRIMNALRVPGARLAFWLYPVLVSVVSRLARRPRNVCGPACTRPWGTAPLTPESRRLFVSL